MQTAHGIGDAAPSPEYLIRIVGREVSCPIITYNNNNFFERYTNMKISLVIPMYNESSIVADTVRAVYGAMEDFSAETGHDYEVLFSNDGSTDNCADIARSVAAELGADKIIVTGYEKNRGKGGAVRHAMLEADGDVLVCTDCDLAYGLDVVGQSVKYFEGEDAPDILIGSRRLGGDGYEGYTFVRKIASKAYMLVLRVVAGFKMSDSQCGFKVYKNAAAKKIFADLETNGFAFDQEVLMSANALGMVVAEMPVRIINHRESTVNVVSDSVKMVRDLLRIKKMVRVRYKR